MAKKPDPKDYESFLKRVQEKLEHIDEASIKEALDHAKETAIALGELSKEEAQVIFTYVKRDLAHAADFLQETGEGLQRWMQMDISLLESSLYDAFSKVADKTLLDQQKLDFRLERGPVYQAGEIVGLGTLQCDACGEVIQYKQATEIKPCPVCGETAFSRLA